MKTNTFARSRETVHEITDAKAIDGDTIIGRIDLGFGASLERRFRLKGFYAPELNGANPAAGHAATARLQGALDFHTLTFPARGSRDDRFGRLLIQLHFNGVPLDGTSILGELQMTEEQHCNDLNFAAKAKRQKGGVL